MLGKLFGKGTFLESHIEDWCLETWAWMLRNLGGLDRLSRTPLVTPNAAFFPPSETNGDERGAYVFGRVKQLMGMQEWDCRLEPYDRRSGSQRVGEYWFVHSRGAPQGTFSVKDGVVRVAYARDLLDDPVALVGTFAHELCHYLIAVLGEPCPGGEETLELATELATAFSGFGVFRANRAHFFERHQDAFGQGYRSGGSGYLSERTWAFAIALFLSLRREPGAAQAWLKPQIASDVAKACRYLERNPHILESLRGAS